MKDILQKAFFKHVLERRQKMDWDLEDFIEEVKFQMTQYDYLEDEKIFEWEEKARKWVEMHKDKKYIKYKSKDEIYLALDSEDTEVMEKIARIYYKSVKNKTEEAYWKTFHVL